jgi:hypothetical protein
MAVCRGGLDPWSQSVQPRGTRAALATRSAPGSRSSWMHAALAAAGKTSPSRSSRGCAGRGGAGADVPRRAQATRGVLALAHAWRPGEGSVEPWRDAQASQCDESGNSIPKPARRRGLQRREAACAIASECPLYCSCGHRPECPRLHKTGHCAKYGQNIGAAEPLEIRHLRNK